METRDYLLLGALGLALYVLHRRQKAKRLPRESMIPTRRNPGRLSPTERQELSAAKELSERFHGEIGEVIELAPTERRMPRYAVAMGALDELTYAPPRGSSRGHSKWSHESGDRGILAKKSRKKPLLAVDPLTRKPIIVQHHSPMKMVPDHGLVG